MSANKLKPAKREETDVRKGFAAAGAFSIAIAVGLLGLLVLWLFPHSRADQQLRFPPPRYPEPALQENPEADLQAFAQKEASQLNGFGWIDESAGVAHIPIEEAMRQIAEEKIAGWPGAPAAPQPSAQPAPERPHVANRKVPAPRPSASDRPRLRSGGVGAKRGRDFLPPKTRRPASSRRHVP